MSPLETPCETHESQIQENSRKIAELETRADYKDKRIDELNNKMDKIEGKLDNLTDTVNSVVVNSIKDDNDLKEEVTKLKTRMDTQDKLLKEYREQRDEDRAKTTQKLTYITVGVCILTFLLNVVVPYIIK